MKRNAWIPWVLTPMLWLVIVAGCGDDSGSVNNSNDNNSNGNNSNDNNSNDNNSNGNGNTSPQCADSDGDGYGVGAACQGADCNEEDAQCWQAGDTCCTAPACGDAHHSGEGTYYTFADGSGNCSFPPTPNDLMVAAINNADYGSSEPCGSCAQIQGPDGSVTVRIVDRCPECPAGDLDLSPEAFELIAPLSAGRVDITWQFVPCNVTGPIRYFFKEGSNQWWTAVQIRNHRHAIDRLEYQESGGSWIGVARLDYNFFVEAAGMGPGPYTFRVTDIHGAVLTDTGLAFVEAGEVEGAAQLPPCE